MRRRIYREDVPTNDGRLLTATTWPEAVALLLVPGEQLGRVYDIRREDDGWVTGECEVNASGTDPAIIDGLFAEADFTAASHSATFDDTDAPLLTVNGAQLRCVWFGDHPVWEDM